MHPESLPLRPASAALAFGRTCVVAPHPDDESLACGGAITLLRRAGIPVFVLFISDGTGSHPVFAPVSTASGCVICGRGKPALRSPVSRCRKGCLAFLRLRDTAVPGEGETGFPDAVARCREHLAAFAPDTVLLPWRRDYHRDHRATWEIVQAAIADWPMRPHLRGVSGLGL